MQKVLNLILKIKQSFHIIKFIIAQMSGFKFYSMGGFLLRKKCEKCIAFSRSEFALQTRAFQGSAIASFLRYASELATPALTILATV